MSIQFQEYEIKPIVSHVGIHRTPLRHAPGLLEQAVSDGDEANRFMRMFYLFQGTQQESFSLELQQKALSIRRIYKIDLGNELKTLRVLAVLSPGDMMQNLPIDYLLEGQGVELNVMYLLPNQPLPEVYPEHDVTVFALGQSTQNEGILRQLSDLMPNWPKPYVNHPKWISLCARDQTYRLLKDIEGLQLAKQIRLPRTDIANLIYPCTIRPIDSHAGEDFELLQSASELSTYLQQHVQEEFYVSDYLNYQSADGFYRKFRVAMIQGVPFVSHLAVGEHWVVSYLSARMELSAYKRKEEAQFMQDFECNIAQKFKAQFTAIHEKIPLDYLVLDCAVSRVGELIVFEIDNSAWVHNTDSKKLFPYKDEPMRALMSQFVGMLHAKKMEMI